MTNGSKGSRYSGSVYVAEWKTQNSTTYYYNRSGAREQEEFLLEYKFLYLVMFVRGIVEKLNDVARLSVDCLMGENCCKT